MLEKTIAYLRDYYPGVFTSCGYNEMVDELTKAIEKSSISAVTKQIREHTSCPAIVKCVDIGKYTFYKCAKEVYLDWDLAWVSREGATYGFNGFKATCYFSDGKPVLVSADHPKYDGYYLFYWIKWGDLCEECGAPFVAMDEEDLCSVCARQYQVLEYSARAEDILETEELPKKKDLLGRECVTETLFGVELEYENVTARQVGKALKHHAISKHDGSVRNGVEIVTRPACVETHKKSLLPFYEQVKVAAKSNTGMHVHVDKSKLSGYQIGFMMEFLNKDSLIPHIEEIAGRSYSTNTYCKTVSGRKMTWGNSFDESKYKLHKKATDKYSPLNTAKDKTIEIRIFSSPESHEEVCAKLDFVAALVKYSSPYSVSVKKLSDKFEWDVFTDFVKMNKKEFPHFVSYYLKKENV